MLAILLTGGRDNENFFACGAGEPAAQARKLFRGGAREKKSVGFVDEGGKVPRGAEVKYIDIVLFVVLFVALISALYVQESDGIVMLYLMIITTIFNSSNNNNM